MLPWQTIDAYLLAKGVKVGAASLAQSTGGTHVPTSYHYQGLARDYGSNSNREAIAMALLALANGAAPVVIELFYSPLGIFYKNGKKFTPDDKLRRDHMDHVHVAVRGGTDLRKYLPIAIVGGGALVLLVAAILVGTLAGAKG